MQVITSTQALAALCKQLATHDYVTVDTEFLREQTFWPKLCLVQLAGPDIEAIVDPMAAGLKLDPLWELMADETTVKVFHAARQDLEIVWTMAGLLPHPIFDTQVAAMVCGFGDSVSYSNLVKKVTGKDIDKSSRFTDWSRRPLSDKQLIYALGDVTHLRDAYRVLSARIAAEGRQTWIAEEMAVLTDPAIYSVEPDDAWKRLKVRSGSKKFLAALKGLAAWREREAQARDVPRQRILKDDALLDIASHAPRTVAELDGLRSVPRGYAQSRGGAQILEAISAGLALPPDQVPVLERSERMPDSDSGLVDALKLLLKLKSDESGVAARLIANAADIERLAAFATPDVPAVHGWRRDVFGAAALDLKAGKLVLKIENGKLKASA